MTRTNSLFLLLLLIFMGSCTNEKNTDEFDLLFPEESVSFEQSDLFKNKRIIPLETQGEFFVGGYPIQGFKKEKYFVLTNKGNSNTPSGKSVPDRKNIPSRRTSVWIKRRNVSKCWLSIPSADIHTTAISLKKFPSIIRHFLCIKRTNRIGCISETTKLTVTINCLKSTEQPIV